MLKCIALTARDEIGIGICVVALTRSERQRIVECYKEGKKELCLREKRRRGGYRDNRHAEHEWAK